MKIKFLIQLWGIIETIFIAIVFYCPYGHQRIPSLIDIYLFPLLLIYFHELSDYYSGNLKLIN